MASRMRNVCFTSFAGPPRFDPDTHKYMVYQRETCPATGNPHYQGYLELHNAKSIKSIQRSIGDPQAHLEERKGTAQEARNYCMKLESRLEEPVEHGQISQQGKRSDLDRAIEVIKETKSMERLAQECPREIIKFHRGLSTLNILLNPPQHRPKPQITVYWGVPGSGKSYRAFMQEPNAYVCTDNLNGWFDGYDGHEAVIFDEFRGLFPFSDMLRLLDHYPLRLPVKGGFVAVSAFRFIFTSNLGPDAWYGENQAFQRRITQFGTVHFCPTEYVAESVLPQPLLCNNLCAIPFLGPCSGGTGGGAPVCGSRDSDGVWGEAPGGRTTNIMS